MWRSAAIAALLLVGACGPDLGGLEQGEADRVTAVQRADALALESGMRVLLAEVGAPDGEAAFADEARAELETIAQGRKVRLAYGGAKRLRARQDEAEAEAHAETAVAHVFAQSEGGRWIWVQREMVARGAAWVRPRATNHARARELLEVEAEARAAKRGLWALADYRALDADEAAGAARAANVNCRAGAAPFRIVEGRVADARIERRRAALVLAAPQAREDEPASSLVVGARQEEAAGAFSIVIFGDAFADWDGAPLFSFEGERVRARGALGMFRDAPQICIDRAEQIEVLGR